ncbi:MAG: maleylpyruvate isomerase N-terminal domain-containing protein [Desertimonas sp.]
MHEPEREIARLGAEDATARLLARLAGVSVDPATPSRLPGWSRGHVLTHLARNADSMFRVLDGLASGDVDIERYPGGAASRDRDIDAGAGRPFRAARHDVESSARRLHARWSEFDHWEGRSTEATGHTIPVTDLPMMRWREVEVHGVDLDLGLTPADWPALFVRLELRAMEMRWRARRPMGMTGLPPDALALDPPTRLAWLYGRAEVDGLPAAGIL